VNDLTRITAITLSIAAVERDTGLSKDTLRVWERRYGFPTPGRDPAGERAYTFDQVEKLRVIKRLLDAGHRPGRIVPLPFAELQQIADSTVEKRPAGGFDRTQTPPDLGVYMGLIRSHDVRGLKRELTRALSRLGVARFVSDVAGPLSGAVGEAWMRGQLEVHEEHSTSEAIQIVLRQALASLPEAPSDSRPNVLLTTFPGEPHGQGLLMAEAYFALEGCHCVSLGPQTPLWDIVLAASAYRVDIVALAFTGCMNPNQVADGLAELRSKLPRHVWMWAGGTAPVLHRRRIDGVEAMASLLDIPAGLARWRGSVAGVLAQVCALP
jgi:MerR family transcriptional regulator, light-induced transcriptional regulator